MVTGYRLQVAVADAGEQPRIHIARFASKLQLVEAERNPTT
jgi:hypothetical protein